MESAGGAGAPGGMVEGFEVQVVYLDGAALVAVAGDVDLATVDRLVERATAALYRAARAVEIDMSRVTFFDSEGIRGLLRILSLGTEVGVPVKLSDASEPVRRQLRLMSLDTAFGLAPA